VVDIGKHRPAIPAARWEQASSVAVWVALAMLLVAALWLRLPGLTAERFHEDEAIYSAWAWGAASGQDAGFDHTAIDKPPIFLSMLALSFRVAPPVEATARWPNMIAALLIVVLTYRLGRRLYNRRTGLVAAIFVTLSPFTISFGPTVFTDPWMVVFILGSLEAAAGGFAEGAGLAAGLATMTKPTAPLFLPLIIALLLAAGPQPGQHEAGDSTFSWWPTVRRFLLGFGIVIALGLAWDATRHQRPGFLFHGAEGYGGLSLARTVDWGERLGGWLTWLGYFTASRWLNLLAALGIGSLLVAGGRHENKRFRLFDRLLAGFVLLYLLTQWLFTFHVWDRYLLGLVPLVAILFARATFWLLGAGIARMGRGRPRPHSMGYAVVVALFFVAAMTPQALRAAQGGYPLGGDHGAYQGIDQVATFLRQEAPAGSIIFHYRLRRHFAYYLFGAPFDFRWYSTPQSLATQAAASPAQTRYTVIPSWRDFGPLAAQLAAGGLRWQVVYRAHRRDGSVSFTIYRITGPLSR